MKPILLSLLFIAMGLTTNNENEELPVENISSLNILKENKLSSINLFLLEEQNNGIIKAAINHTFESKSQKELNSFFGQNETNDIYVNGYLVENKNQYILTESIKKIELINANNFKIKAPVLNIII